MSLLAIGMFLAQGATATATRVLPQPLPQPVQAALSAYQDCLFDAINEQYRTGIYSERRVISVCAGVRRASYAEAMVRVNEARQPSIIRRVRERFAELDESVWTVVGHIRARHASR